AYKEELRLAPNDPRAQFDLGYAYVKVGNTDLAREQLRKLSTVDAMLALRLESEIKAATQPSTLSPQAKPWESPAGDNPVSRKVDTMSARTQSPIAKEQTPEVQPPPANTSSTKEQSSRQLQQLPPAQSQSQPTLATAA